MLRRCPPIPSWCRPWTRSAPCAPPRSGCARSAFRSRLPLPRSPWPGPCRGARSFGHLIASELNVKAVHFAADRTALGTEVIRPNLRVLGPRLGKEVQAVLKAAKAGDWSRADDGSVVVGGHPLHDGEFELGLETAEDVAPGRCATSTPKAAPSTPAWWWRSTPRSPPSCTPKA
ncbi:MAG: DUF5915 domain-containing protein [Acidimicrobiales bacterium]